MLPQNAEISKAGSTGSEHFLRIGTECSVWVEWVGNDESNLNEVIIDSRVTRYKE